MDRPGGPRFLPPGSRGGALLRRAGIAALAAVVTGVLLAAPARAFPRAQATPAIPRSYVWGWGSAILGNGKYHSAGKPVPVHGLPSVPVKQVLGQDVALLGNGTVWAWPEFRLPAQLTQLSGITHLTATSGYNCGYQCRTFYALSSDGTVWAWGSGLHGELGDGSDTSTPVPVQVAGLTGVTSVVAGGDSAYALEGNGTVWAWGRGSSGQLGDGATGNSDVPVQVKLSAPATQVASDCGSAYAVTSDHQVFSWGANTEGQLGDGNLVNARSPRLVRRVSDAGRVVAGCVDAYAIIQPAGTVMAWGYGVQGEMGDGRKATQLYAVPVTGLSGVTSLSTGFYTTYAVSGGIAWAWGYGLRGQLGTGVLENSDVPVQVINITSPVASVTSGQYLHSGQNTVVAVGTDGSVWSWGQCSFGSCGGGGFGDSPGQIPRIPPVSSVGPSLGGMIWYAVV
jgi:alpha-tubulin suppressor-like RCC1 family protein